MIKLGLVSNPKISTDRLTTIIIRVILNIITLITNNKKLNIEGTKDRKDGTIKIFGSSLCTICIVNNKINECKDNMNKHKDKKWKGCSERL